MATKTTLVEDITMDQRATKTEIKSFFTMEHSSGCRVIFFRVQGSIRVRCDKRGLNICVLTLLFMKRVSCHTVGGDHVCRVQEQGIQ